MLPRFVELTILDLPHKSLRCLRSLVSLPQPDTTDCTKRVTPEFSPFHFSISLCTRTVQSGFLPHVTFLVQKLLGKWKKSGKEKTPG